MALCPSTEVHIQGERYLSRPLYIAGDRCSAMGHYPTERGPAGRVCRLTRGPDGSPAAARRCTSHQLPPDTKTEPVSVHMTISALCTTIWVLFARTRLQARVCLRPCDCKRRVSDEEQLARLESAVSAPRCAPCHYNGRGSGCFLCTSKDVAGGVLLWDRLTLPDPALFTWRVYGCAVLREGGVEEGG